MLIPLISAIWLATALLVVAVCRTAARGERVTPVRAGGAQRSPRLLDAATGSWEQTTGSWERALTLRLEDRRPARPSQMRRPARLRSRARSETATAEHVRNGAQQDLYVRP